MAWHELNHETSEQVKLSFYVDTPNDLLNVWRVEDEKSMMYCIQRIFSILAQGFCNIYKPLCWVEIGYSEKQWSKMFLGPRGAVLTNN